MNAFRLSELRFHFQETGFCVRETSFFGDFSEEVVC